MADGCSSRPEVELGAEPESWQVLPLPHPPLGHLPLRHHALLVRHLLQGHVRALLDGVLFSGELLLEGLQFWFLVKLTFQAA